MAKKILAIVGAIVIVAFVVLGVTTCGIMKVADEALKEREPQLREYVKMTEEQQNDYVSKNMDDIIATVAAEAKTDKSEDQKARKNFEEIKDSPEYRAACLKLGRSIMAMYVISSEPIVADLSEEDKAKYQAESDQLAANLDALSKVEETAK